MICCGEKMEVIEDEPLGRLRRCNKCMAEKSEFFDENKIQTDGIQSEKGDKNV